jgi:hypothetical protein
LIQRDGIAVTRPPSVAMTSTVATTSVLPTSTWVLSRPLKYTSERLMAYGRISRVGSAPSS